MQTSTATPKILPDTIIGQETRKVLLTNLAEESQVIVHCRYAATQYADAVRIWKTTFLISSQGRHRSSLIHVEGITIHPTWMPVSAGTTARFTLVFSGLPKGCQQFNLVEEIPEPNGWIVTGIERNSTDVYEIDLD